jgi:hypothetical protein
MENMLGNQQIPWKFRLHTDIIADIADNRRSIRRSKLKSTLVNYPESTGPNTNQTQQESTHQQQWHVQTASNFFFKKGI